MDNTQEMYATAEDPSKLTAEPSLKRKVKMTIYKGNVSHLKQSNSLSIKANEVLQRTKQFRLNDVFTSFSNFKEEDTCWLISLGGCHGSYGLVSVCVFDQSFPILKQWVISCRVLQRMVGRRVLFEIIKDVSKHQSLQLSFNQTEHNAPIVKFLESFDCYINKTGLSRLTIADIQLSQTGDSIYHIETLKDAISFDEKAYPQEGVQDIDEEIWRNIPFAASKTKKDVIKTEEEEWCSSITEQTIRHNLIPIIPSHRGFQPVKEDLDEQAVISNRTSLLKSTWIEIIGDKDPLSTNSFLEVGGDSLSAAFLASKLQRTLNIDISIDDVLTNPTYGELQKIVLQAESKSVKQQSKSPKVQRIPLSAAQQRMLIMQESAPESTAYVETIALYTKKRINPSEIFELLLKQHPILNGKLEFSDECQCYVMTIQEEKNIYIEKKSAENLKAASEYLTKTTPSIKELSKHNSLVKLRQMEAGEFTLLALHIHHVIVDRITLNKISNDLLDLMEKQICQSCKELYWHIPNFADDFSSSQRRRDALYWCETFVTIPPEISLAILPQTEAVWKDTEVYNAKHCNFQISIEVVQSIIMFCQTLGLTPFQYFLACTLIVLHRYLGNEETALALPVSTRTDINQNTDGLYVNTVLFRSSIDYGKTFESYLMTVAGRWMETLRHSKFPLDELVKILWKKHEKSPSSFCCTMLDFTSEAKATNALYVLSKHAKMPLSLDILYNKTKRASELVVEWASELIDDGVAKRLAEGVINMFNTAVKTPDKILSKIEVLSPLESKLLQSFSHCDEENLSIEIQPIQVLFEQHAAINPNMGAVSCNGSSLSYKQLNSIASSIACALFRKLSQATLKSKPVVIVMQRDELVIASVLGIWKAGGHFLPVASNMLARLNDIVERCEPAAVVFNIPLEIGSGKSFPIINIDDLMKYPAEKFEKTQNVNKDNDLAYIITTSGSTGKPKHCKVTHKSLKTFAQAWIKGFHLSNFRVTLLQWAPLSFDTFISDVVRGLICVSGQLIICPERFRLDVVHILSLIKNYNITVAEFTPHFCLDLVENCSKDDLASLRLLIVGSDTVQRHVFEKIKSVMKEEQKVINLYGITEATIDSCFFEGSVIPKTRSGTIPIGKPLPGVKLHILDTKTRLPCPVGTIGELYISGDVLATGDVELTHLNNVPCVALKTGDAACWLPTGDVDLIGRLDSLVKLRGFRISTHEIEEKIITHVKGVRQCYVLPMLNEADSHRSKFLCAFLVLENNVEAKYINHIALRLQLCGHLPYFMLPDIVHVIKSIPLTVHGKINLKALPNLSQLLELNAGNLTTQSPSPVSPTASFLKELMREALGLPDSTSINQDLTFMDLGAHSLILVRLSSLIKQKLFPDIEIVDLHSYPTITTLADYIDNAMEGNKLRGN